MEKSNYSKTFYALLGASLGGILVGGYLTAQNFFTGAKPEPSLIIKNSFEMALDDIKEELSKNNKNLNEEILIKIIGLIKEYADYLFEKRNKLNISERRSIYKKLINKDTNFNSLNNLYKACCNEYIGLYKFSLSLAKNYIFKKIKIEKKEFYANWEKLTQNNEIYHKIIFYSNMFNTYRLENERNSEKLVEIFEVYANNLIDEVSKLEYDFGGTPNNNEKDSQYLEQLQFIKLKLSDELFVKHDLEDKELRYMVVIKNKKESIVIKHYLEKINGIEFITIGL